MMWLVDLIKAQLPRLSPDELGEIIREAKRLLE